MVSRNDRREEPDPYTSTRPVLVIEILSPSTAATDLREKRLAYQSLPSVVDYLVVAQDERSAQRYTREAEGWTQAEFGAGESVELESVGLSLPMDEMYEDVFDPGG